MTTTWTSLQRWLCLLLLAAMAGKAPTAHAAEPKVLSISPAQLRELGLAIDTSRIDAARRLALPRGVAATFPNRCYGALSVSDELLARMLAQGFTLQTLCIGLSSAHVAFHPETGAALTQVRVMTLKDEGGRPDEYEGVVDLLIDIPKCFAAGTPYLDCKLRFEWTHGERDAGLSWLADNGRLIDSTMQKVLAKGGFRRECGCGDLRVKDYHGPEAPHYQQDVWRKPAAACRVDTMPECPQLRARFSVAGSLLREFIANDIVEADRGLARQLGFPDSGWGVLNEDFEVSPALPRGYAYNFITPEGDNDKQAKAPSSGLKLSVGSR